MLWEAIQPEGENAVIARGVAGQSFLTVAECDELLALANDAGGWWDDAPDGDPDYCRFVPMAEWLAGKGASRG